MTSQSSRGVLIIGGRGEFGQFLQRDILPALGAEIVLTLERDTPPEQHIDRLRQARHIILATPLAGYAECACELVHQCGDLIETTTLWLISSVQAGVWRAVTETLAVVANPYLAAVFVHPMYGPNGFRAKEREAETFRNILTARIDGAKHRTGEEVAEIANAFRSKLSIGTTTDFDPEAHDRATAYSQGLSYCVAQVMFERPEIDAAVKEQLPDLHRSFHANQNLISDFLRINSYMPEVIGVFTASWQRTTQSTYADLLHAFAQADTALSRGANSMIPTKWYEKLRAASVELISGALDG
jgi:prephenate dehydrogenase